MIFHYCRVSSKDQCLDRQIAALDAYKPCDRRFSDKQSGKNFNREQYQAMKACLNAGDEVIVEELDRLGRNKTMVKEELKWFKEHGVTVRILDLPTSLIDFKDQEWVHDMVNNILVEVLGAIAEQERVKIHKRQSEGIAAKKARGEWDDYGRPRIELDEYRFQKILKKQKSGQITADDAAKVLGISRATYYLRAREHAKNLATSTSC